MSLQGPLVVVAGQPVSGLSEALSAAGAFPVVDSSTEKAVEAIDAAQPGAVLLADDAAAADATLAEWLSRRITPRTPIIPVLACVTADADIAYAEALPLGSGLKPQRILERLSGALRARSLHAAVLRRAEMARDEAQPLPDVTASDPLDDATVIVAGRGRAYPALSVAIGERAGAIGTLSMETAARYLKSRDADGLVIGDGFGARNVEAFLTAIGEDNRFRDLPVGVLAAALPNVADKFPNVVVAADAEQLAARILPYVRLHAFEERLRRILAAFDNKTIIDPATGLLMPEAFIRDLELAVADASARNTGLSVARFSFDTALSERASRDAARLVSRLVRSVDFGCRDDDGTIVVAFTETDLRHAHVVARRIASVLKHTMLTPANKTHPIAPAITLATRKSSDTVASLLARITAPAVAAE